MTRARITPVLLCTGLALAATWPIFRHFDYWGRGDWDQHFFYQAVPRRTLLEYRQWPLWNPWYCGGMVMLANPQSRFLSPTFALVLAFGTVHGVKLEIPLHFALGLLGAFVLLRQWRASRLASVLGAGVYGLCTMFAEGLAEGMTWLMACAYTPWALAFLDRALRAGRTANGFPWLVACAAALALMFFNGGAYPLAWTCLLLSLHALGHALHGRPRSMPRVAKSMCTVALAIGLAVLLGAVKFVPALAYMRAHPRQLSDHSGYSSAGLVRSLVDWNARVQAGGDVKATWTWEENAAYVGMLPLLLAALGLRAQGRRRWPLAAMLALLLWLSLGQLAPVSLWDALRSLPVFSSMRVAQRARLVGMLLVAAFAAFGLDALAGPERCRRVAAAGVVVLVLGRLVSVNACIFARTFTVPPAEPVRQGPFVQISKLDDVDAAQYVRGLAPLAQRTLSMLYPAFLCNVGTVDALESAGTLRRPIGRNKPEYRGEAFVYPSQKKARIAQWTPNRVVVEASLDGPGQVVLNQNYARGWRVRGGTSGAKWVNGFIGCDAAPGESRITFEYRPTSAVWGAWLSLATLAAVAAGLALSKKHRRDSGHVTAAMSRRSRPAPRS